MPPATIITISPEARAAFEAFKAKREGIADRYRTESAGRESMADRAAIKPAAVDQRAAVSLLTETGSKLSENFQKARESFKASDRAKTLAEVAGSPSDDTTRGSAASRAEGTRGRFGSDNDDRFGLNGPAHTDGPGLHERSRFGANLGPERVKFATAFRAYERVEASAPATAFSAARAFRVALGE